MSRRKSAVKRTILPDARYDSQTVSKFINVMMYAGKKATAERMFYGAMDLVESRTSQPGVTVFKQALSNRFGEHNSWQWARAVQHFDGCISAHFVIECIGGCNG